MSRDSENRTDACQHGLVPCSTKGARLHHDYTLNRERNAQAWSYLLRDANAARKAAVAALSPYSYSLVGKARDAGIVPHGSGATGAIELVGRSARSLDPACNTARQHNRNAAALIGFEYRHQREYVFHATAWEIAR